MKLRPYQLKAIADLESAYADGTRSVCLCAPTGAGKTVIFAEIARAAAEAGCRTVILVHRDNLLQQATEKLRDFGVSYSVIAPGHRFFGDHVAVASKDTLARRLDLHHFDLIIIDEGHHATAGSYRRILDRWPDAHALGVTATPGRPDGTGLDSVYSKLVMGPTIRQLIDDGYLVEPVYYGPSRKIDLGAVHTVAGDYNVHELAETMDKMSITDDAVERYRAVAPGTPAIAFCVNVKHAEDVAAQFCRAGYRFASVDGTMPVSEIRRRIGALTTGELNGITSCDLVSEGTDVPRVSTVICLRPTKSIVVNLQQVGRGLRPVFAPGFDLEDRAGRLAAIAAGEKPHCTVLDHAGNYTRHGFADDEREWTLRGRKKRPGAAGVANVPVRQCPKCYLAHRPAPACPFCGHVYEVAAEVPQAEAGTLEKIDKDALRRARAKMIAQARTYDQLKEVGRKLGFQNPNQWAWRIYMERGGNPARA